MSGDIEDLVEVPEPTAESPVGRIAAGAEVIRAALRTMPFSPGVYRMLDAKGDVLYVGKARSLKRRVVSYTHVDQLSVRLRRMVSETVTVEIVTTHTEVEALLLESNLIKRLRPRFNVLLRDDKSFPDIILTGDHPFPQIAKHRGSRSRPGRYFGPFASAGSVNRTIIALQRAFLVRNCADTVFAQRTRPCLQHQIKRCTAPCVGRVTAADYAAQVADAEAFLSGRSRAVQAGLVERMQAASDALDFESAALYRDRIRALTQIQAHQDINVAGIDEADVIAAHQAGGQTCIQVFFFRGGQNLGNHPYFPSHDRQLGVEDVLGAFVGQFYDNKTPPALILLSHAVPEQDLLGEALSVRAERKVELFTPQRGDRRKLVEHALTNAREAHGRRLAESATQRQLLEGVARVFALPGLPERIEIYDNSHIQGAHAVGAMVVAGPEGFVKGAYRKFTIRDPKAAGDDFAMMREVFTRRFVRALEERAAEAEAGEGTERNSAWPDLVLIDGGAGQLSAAQAVLADLGVGDVPLVAIAKGPDRDAGRERFFTADRPPISLEQRDPVLYFLQRLRDEAHRFAIGTHRAKRTKALGQSPLDEVPGIGPRRKRALLHHFGSARAVARAGLADLESVPGINKAVARLVYDFFHGNGP
ncbi:excinuclease ABC subunit C [Stella humosa]|uniref:UvrABC system protein C n=1 Tax=Stella humosa TaxID=94 RepID=A0A3N1KVV0_9PROT|nr:excinuclease ABC subunit UvrC [Stella humosa]ROP84074.1 excinuclease ABC subunit C [Stella humosa]BBK33586.1 UvrABC system protein C [Stella humosa]